jgi:hypothetical protein
MLIFNIKTDKDKTFVTRNYLASKKLFLKNKQTKNGRNNKAGLQKRKLGKVDFVLTALRLVIVEFRPEPSAILQSFIDSL